MNRMLRQLFGALWLAAAVLAAPAFAQPSASAPDAAASAASIGIAPADDAWRAALPRDPEAATQAYLDRLSPEVRARSDAYFEGGYWLQLWNLLLGLLIAWLLLAAAPARAVRRWCARRKRRVAQVASYAAFYLAAFWLLGLPLAIYQNFVREHQYGLATQTFGAWFGEQLTALAVALVIGTLAILAFYGAIRRWPRHWWVGASIVAVGLLGVLVAIAPVFIEPLFNTYKPLADTPLKRDIVAMAQANGVPAANVYEFDASRQSKRVSANVSGLFGTASIRLNDNLLERATAPEIRAVMGHEIGHYTMNHIAKTLLQLGLVIVAAFAFVAWAAARLLRRFGSRWQLESVQDVGSLPLLGALLAVAFFVATPVINTITRTMETEADYFGLNLAREPDGMAEVMLKLVEYRKPDPGPIEEMLFFDHPSARTRIFNAMRWKALMQPPP
ncbi:MAG TPA: M48 family metallopeptidase [Burkholderiaceae bacterium]|nr:M48 family metallopeptidase [Burkholderiaceae bacterium]